MFGHTFGTLTYLQVAGVLFELLSSSIKRDSVATSCVSQRDASSHHPLDEFRLPIRRLATDEEWNASCGLTYQQLQNVHRRFLAGSSLSCELLFFALQHLRTARTFADIALTTGVGTSTIHDNCWSVYYRLTQDFMSHYLGFAAAGRSEQTTPSNVRLWWGENPVSCLVDCSYLGTTRSKNPELHKTTYSKYKAHHLCKYLVVTDLLGRILWVGDLFGSSHDGTDEAILVFELTAGPAAESWQHYLRTQGNLIVADCGFRAAMLDAIIANFLHTIAGARIAAVLATNQQYNNAPPVNSMDIVWNRRITAIRYPNENANGRLQRWTLLESRHMWQTPSLAHAQLLLRLAASLSNMLFEIRLRECQ